MLQLGNGDHGPNAAGAVEWELSHVTAHIAPTLPLYIGNEIPLILK